jgi:hypothetical protein
MSRGLTVTRDEAAREILQCGRDPNYFTYNYAKISHPIRGLIPFHTYPFQAGLLQDYNNYRFNVVLKARQLGVTWTTAAYAAWLIQYYKEKSVLAVATKLEVAAGFVRKVKTIIKHLPSWVRIARITVDNRTSFELSNGSLIKAVATSGDTGRSEALSLLVVDEAAFVEGLEELWSGLYSTLSTGGRCIMISTPSGVGTFYHKTYTNAEAGQNDFHPIKLLWDIHPERDQAWFNQETKNMSPRQVAQELMCSFSMSGETVIDPVDILRMREGTKDPKFRIGFDRNLWIWEEPIIGEKYLFCADVARGDGKDYTAGHMAKLKDMTIVAEYQGKPDLDVFAEFINTLGKEYNNAMLALEINNMGYHVAKKLLEFKYPVLFYAAKGSTLKYIDPLMVEYQEDWLPGFTTSVKTRPLIIAKLEEMIRHRTVTSYSKRLVSELDTFVWNNGRPESLAHYNDDLVMSLAVLCWIRDEVIVEASRVAEYNKAFINAIIKSTNVLDTRVSGMLGHKQDKAYWQNHFQERIENELGSTLPVWGYRK